MTRATWSARAANRSSVSTGRHRIREDRLAQPLGEVGAAGLARLYDVRRRVATKSATNFWCVDLPAPSTPSRVTNLPRTPPSAAELVARHGAVVLFERAREARAVVARDVVHGVGLSRAHGGAQRGEPRHGDRGRRQAGARVGVVRAVLGQVASLQIAVERVPRP